MIDLIGAPGFKVAETSRPIDPSVQPEKGAKERLELDRAWRDGVDPAGMAALGAPSWIMDGSLEFEERNGRPVWKYLAVLIHTLICVRFPFFFAMLCCRRPMSALCRVNQPLFSLLQPTNDPIIFGSYQVHWADRPSLRLDRHLHLDCLVGLVALDGEVLEGEGVDVLLGRVDAQPGGKVC